MYFGLCELVLSFPFQALSLVFACVNRQQSTINIKITLRYGGVRNISAWAYVIVVFCYCTVPFMLWKMNICDKSFYLILQTFNWWCCLIKHNWNIKDCTELFSMM